MLNTEREDQKDSHQKVLTELKEEHAKQLEDQSKYTHYMSVYSQYRMACLYFNIEFGSPEITLESSTALEQFIIKI